MSLSNRIESGNVFRQLVVGVGTIESSSPLLQYTHAIDCGYKRLDGARMVQNCSLRAILKVETRHDKLETQYSNQLRLKHIAAIMHKIVYQTAPMNSLSVFKFVS